jgi:hypothetical protein
LKGLKVKAENADEKTTGELIKMIDSMKAKKNGLKGAFQKAASKFK